LGIGRIGSIVGPYLGGVLLQLSWTPSALFLLVAIPSLVAALGIGRHEPHRARAAR